MKTPQTQIKNKKSVSKTKRVDSHGNVKLNENQLHIFVQYLIVTTQTSILCLIMLYV